MIPSIGRVVWVNSPILSDQLCAAIITYVHNQDSVNLVVFDRNGDLFPKTLVHFYHGNDGLIPTGTAGWMPYQVQTEAKRLQPKESAGPTAQEIAQISERLNLQAKQISDLQAKLEKAQAAEVKAPAAAPTKSPQAAPTSPAAK